MKVESVEKEAIKCAISYEENKGNKVLNVSKARGEHGGYDLLSEDKNGKKIKIEVKGATRYEGIPDPYHTEFDGNSKEMVADFLYVFYFPRDEEEYKYGPKIRFYKIPRGAIKPEELKEKWGWVIKRSFKKRIHDFEEEYS